MLSVVMPSVVMLKVIMLNVIMLVVRLSVVMQNVVMPSVMAPFWHNSQTEWEKMERFVGNHDNQPNSIQHNDIQPNRLYVTLSKSDTQQK
jgi:hypothetical protein